ncbi:2979_t:CDS:1, partial [Scutellospora calospora]
QKRVEVTHSVYTFIDLNSNEKYVNSDNNSDKSSDNNFIKLDCFDEVDLIIEQLHVAKKTKYLAVHIGNFK